MTGIDILRSVKNIKPQTSVIILTGHASTETAMEAVRLGASEYLTKPVKIQSLITSVRTQLTSVRLAARVKELNEAIAQERDKLRRSLAELELLKRLSERMMPAMSFVEGFEVILNHLVTEVEADVAAIYDLKRGTITLIADGNPSPAELEQLVNVINHKGSELSGSAVNCSIDDFIGISENTESMQDGKLLSTIVPGF